MISAIVLLVVVFVGSWVWYSVVTDVKDVAADEAVAVDEKKNGGDGEKTA